MIQAEVVNRSLERFASQAKVDLSLNIRRSFGWQAILRIQLATSDCRIRASVHRTAKHRPWAVEVYVTFSDETRALTFEKYLKSQALSSPDVTFAEHAGTSLR